GASSVAHLPIVNFHLWPAAIGIGDQYALRAQCPVNYFLIVGETNDLGDLSDQIEADIDAKLVLGLSKEMVESNGLRLMLQNKRGAEFMIRKAISSQHALVLKGFQK